MSIISPIYTELFNSYDKNQIDDLQKDVKKEYSLKENEKKDWKIQMKTPGSIANQQASSTLFFMGLAAQIDEIKQINAFIVNFLEKEFERMIEFIMKKNLENKFELVLEKDPIKIEKSREEIHQMTEKATWLVEKHNELYQVEKSINELNQQIETTKADYKNLINQHTIELEKVHTEHVKQVTETVQETAVKLGVTLDPKAFDNLPEELNKSDITKDNLQAKGVILPEANNEREQAQNEERLLALRLIGKQLNLIGRLKSDSTNSISVAAKVEIAESTTPLFKANDERKNDIQARQAQELQKLDSKLITYGTELEEKSKKAQEIKSDILQFDSSYENNNRTEIKQNNSSAFQTPTLNMKGMRT